MRPLRLYINVDHVATLRQARRTDEPDPLQAALEAEAHGADGITIHLREDRRHIQDADVDRIAASVSTVCNLEIAAREEMIALAERLRPFQVTLVPEKREEITTEGGLSVSAADSALKDTVARLKQAGIRVSLFIDPDQATIEASHRLGVPAVELHTGRYANHWRESGSTLEELAQAAAVAAGMGLAVHAGHGLTRANVAPVAAITEIEELNIGHSIIARALMIGLGPAVAEMKALLTEARR